MDQNMSMFLAPWGLALGCSLIAASLLFFFGVEFLKSRPQAIMAMAGGLAIIFLTELAIIADSGASFFQAQKIDVAKCYAEGEGAFPAEKANNDNAAGHYILGCVAKLGYEWSPDHAKCRDFLVPMNAYCYLPNSMIGRAVTQFQLLFEQ